MPETKSHIEQAADQAETTAALLALGGGLERLALVLTATALLALVLSPPATGLRLCLLGVVITGLAAQFFALRTAFDQLLFAAWARRWREAGSDTEADLAAFDAALAAIQLRLAPGGPPRPLTDRMAGARRLLQQQALCCVLQIAAWLAAVLVANLAP